MILSGISIASFSSGTSENLAPDSYQSTFELPEDNGDGFFTENKGQWDEELLFIGDTSFGQIGLGRGSIYYNMREYIQTDEFLPGLENIQDQFIDPMMNMNEDLPTKVEVKGHVVKYSFDGSNDVVPVGVGERNHKNNYFYGSDQNKWVSGARNFESIIYEDLYEDIDLKYYFSEKGAKYDLILNPGAEPDDIRVQVEGHDSLKIIDNNLDLGLVGGRSIQDRDLVAYKNSDHVIIDSQFIKLDEDLYGFKLENEVIHETIIIDPLVYSTYIGGSRYEYSNTPTMGIDDNGDAIVVGTSGSTDFPVTPGCYDDNLSGSSQDIVVIKMNGDGSDLQFATFIGGDVSDNPNFLDTDGLDNIVVVGYTYSSDFPTTTNAFRSGENRNGASDFFIVRLKNDGSDLLSSTLIGGDASDYFSSNYCDFHVKDNGNVVIGTYTQSAHFPTSTGAFQNTHKGMNEGILFEMRADCTDLVFSTYIGTSAAESISSIDVRSNGDIWVCGYTASDSFPTSNDAMDPIHNGASDLFLMKMKSDGSGYIYSSYIGGAGGDTPADMFIDDSGTIFVTGNTNSIDFPKNVGPGNSGFSDSFIIKFENDMSAIDYCRLIGGSLQETSKKICVDSSGEAVVMGTTTSTDFYTTPGASDRSWGGGNNDLFLYKINTDGSSIVGSTYFGGNGYDEGTFELGQNGEIFIGGYTNSTNLQTTGDADYQYHQGLYDSYFSIMDELLTDLDYSTYYGGDATEYGFLYRSQETGDIYIKGQTQSTNFPTTVGSYDESFNGGNNDIYIMKLIGGAIMEPLSVDSVKPYMDADCLVPRSSFDVGELVHLELVGVDSNATRKGVATVNITFSFSDHALLRAPLRETDNNTGIYRGSFIVPPGTGYCDTLKISSRKDPTKGCELFIEPPFRPSSVTMLEVFSDQVCTVSTDKLDKGDTGYVKIIGVDSNPGMQNKALANLTLDLNSSFKVPFVLEETNMNSGIFIGDFLVPTDMDYFNNFTIGSVRNEAITDAFMIHTPVQIRPLEDSLYAYEDEEYMQSYWNFGYNTGTWNMDTVATWLDWNETSNELYGTPNNNHVGLWDILITLEDAKGHEDSHDYVIEVINKDPIITTEPLLNATESEEYYVDFNCSDDGQGDMEWFIIPDRSWLMINKNTGEVSGAPNYEDVGLLNVSITVRDGHEGVGSIDFQITVEGVNDPPRITTMDIKTGEQGENYYRKYEAHDPDGDSPLTWSLETDARFLKMESDTGILSGTPGKYDVGEFFVNVTASDPHGANSTTRFTLTIENINDMPDWADIPEDTDIIHGETYTFDVNATDPDPGGFIEFDLETNPETDMEIDELTGEIYWIASVLPFTSSIYELDVTIKVTDGELYNRYDYTITVMPTESPTTTIWGPGDEDKVPSDNAILEWEGSDPEEEPLTYDIYLHENQAYVVGLRQEAIYLENYEETTLSVSDLDQGKTYYWMVLPYDGCTVGDCGSGVRSFKINYRPTIESVDSQEVKTGEEFSFKISASDMDTEDSSNLIFTLTEAPTGMVINEETGRVKWKPSSDQEGYHTVKVEVTDGVETTTETFDIEVIKGEGEGLPIALIAGIGGALGLIILVVIIFFVIRKRNGEKKEEVDDEAERIKKEMELHQEEMEWEKQYMKPHDPSNDNSSVALSAAEAHSHDKDNKYDQAGYEDLYGQPAPVVEDGDISAVELKDHISQQIDELQNMEVEE